MTQPLQLSMLMSGEEKSTDLRLRAESKARNFQGDVTRNRHRGNPESEAANERVRDYKSVDQKRIINCLRTWGPKTSKELSRGMNMKYTTVSARLSELKALNLIEKTGERRDGAAVVRVRS